MNEERYFGAQCASCGANMAHNPCCGRAEVLAARLDEARARAEKLAAALREIAESVHADSEGFIVQPCSCPVCVKRLDIAARALAE